MKFMENHYDGGFFQKMKQQYGWKYMLGRHVESVCVILDKAPRQSSYNVNLAVWHYA